jgi:two-component system sensor histidine kinase BaeS
MNSLRIKIVLSLIGMSIFSIALGGFVSRSVLSDRFEDVVTMRSADGFVRDILRYYRAYGSFEHAHEVESFDNYRQRMRPPGPPGRVVNEEFDEAVFIATDINGKVWSGARDFVVGDILSEEYLQNALPIMDNDTMIGYTVVEGQLVLTGIEAQYLQALTNSIWLSLLAVALVAVPLGIVLGKRLADPINNLNNAISSMRPGTMYQNVPNVPITSNDEIGLLSQSFNKMSRDLATFVEVNEQQREKIEETEAMRRQGLVSISHELRTPLYRLVSQAYAMLDGIRSLDREQMTKLADSLDHLSELVNDLHHLALADVHAFSCDIESIDYSQIVRAAIESRAEVFATKNFSLNLSIPEQLVVGGDPTRLRQIIDNLLSNCIRYSKPEGDIKIELTTFENFAQLVVSDSGPGVPPDKLDVLFDRFFRIETSRSRATGGTGLGLSLVKTCAEIHGGNVEAFLSEQGGLGIRVRIPLHSQNH